MLLRSRRRREEGQVTPALLLAIIGGFALAVAFVSLQNLVDQTGRASTASDAAALAAGKGQTEALADLFAGNLGLHLGLLEQILSGQTPVPNAEVQARLAARQYADANGGDVVSFTYDGFDVAERRWEYTVVTRQQDEVSGGDQTAHTRSRSRVGVSITSGVCGGGLVIAGGCRPFDLLRQLCDLSQQPDPEPSPEPSPGPSGGPDHGPSPSPEPSPSPTFTPPPGLEGLGCLSAADLHDLITFDIRLIS